jgi:hypothetical protein
MCFRRVQEYKRCAESCLTAIAGVSPSCVKIGATKIGCYRGKLERVFNFKGTA